LQKLIIPDNINLSEHKYIGGRKFTKVFKEGPLGMALVNPKTFQFEIVNERLCKMLSYSEKELQQKTFKEVTHPDDRGGDLEAAQHLIDGAIPFYTKEKRYLKKNNEPVWIRLNVSVLWDEYGKPEHFLTMVENIDEKKRIEIDLKLSELQYKALAKNLPKGAVLLFGKNLETILFDGKGLSAVGLSKKLISGKKIEEIFSGEALEILRPNMVACLKGEESEFDITIANKVFEVHIVPIKLIDDFTAGMALFHDITGEKEHISELQELNRNKDKFFSIISHDLRSPFSNLLGLTQFLADDIDELSQKEVRDFAEGIYISAKLVFDLLENLLEWSRIQTGRIPYQPVSFNLKSLLHEIIFLFNANSISKNIKFNLNITGEVTVFADRNMLSTVFRNLISNAIKFSHQGGEVSIASNITGKKVIIIIEDFGIGMKKETMKKLFKIESHFTSKGTSGERGTGLGLILTKEFIEKNKGSINVESEYGKGSSFIIELPASE
jgi:PAS domain S-box-containing protein